MFIANTMFNKCFQMSTCYFKSEVKYTSSHLMYSLYFMVNLQSLCNVVMYFKIQTCLLS